mgnify:CR=1 FL=1
MTNKELEFITQGKIDRKIIIEDYEKRLAKSYQDKEEARIRQ